MPEREMVSVFLGLGANLGDARKALEDAVTSIGSLPQTQLDACSSFYRSEPLDAKGPDFINAVLHVKTRLNAFDLLIACQAIENLAGRVRPYQNAPRTLDIDVLLYGDAQIDSNFLTVPHPRMRERAFVLMPLSELAPHLVSPSELIHVRSQTVQKIPYR